jgi:outer membrane protein assembly factor BamB
MKVPDRVGAARPSLAQLGLTLVVGLIALAIAAPASADWNQYRGNAERSASAEWIGDSGPSGVIDWSVRIGENAMVDASPVVNPNTGVIYLGTTANSSLAGTARLFAFYPNGRLQWAVPLDRYSVRAAPAVRRDGHLVIRAVKPVRVVSHPSGYSYWTFKQRGFLVEPFRGGIRDWADVSADYQASPVVDEHRNQSYIRQGGYGLSLFDWSFARVGLVPFNPGSIEGDWGVDSPWLGDFDKSAQAGKPSGDEPAPVYVRYPSPAWSSACDVVMWSAAAKTGLKAHAWRGSATIDIPQNATPAFGKAGRMYIVTYEDHRPRLYAFDQNGQRVWRTAPFRAGTASPPALGRGPGREGGPGAICTRVRDGVVTRVRDNRPEWIYVAVAGTLYAVNGDGYVRWSVNPGADRLGEPAVIRHGGEELIVVSSRGPRPQLSAYRADGRFAWRVRLDAPALGSPAVANGRIYVATTSSLYAIR